MRIRDLSAFALSCCAALPALAQSTVSIYGVADNAVEVVRATGGTGTAAATDVGTTRRLTSEGSYLGFRGREDLGSGFYALFQLEGGVGLDTGTYSSFNRDTFVGLGGERWGSFTMGVNTTPMRALGLAFDLTPGGNTGIGAIQSLLSINRLSSGADNRRTDSLRYRSPTVAGFTVDAAYGFGEQRDTATGRDDNMFGVGLNYRNGPVYVAYAYDRQNDSNRTGLAQTQGQDTRHRLGAKVQVMPQLMIGGFYDAAASEGRFGTGTATGKISKDTFGAIGQYRNGAHGVYAMLVKAQSLECSGTTTGNAANCATAGDTGARMLTLGYTYDFSKRTQIRVAVSRIHNDGAARYDYSNGSIGAGTGADPTGVAFGLRHRF